MAGRRSESAPWFQRLSKAQRIPRAGLALSVGTWSPWVSGEMLRAAETIGRGPPTKTKTRAPLAGSQSLGDNGPWPKSAFLGQPLISELRGITLGPSGTGPSVINPEKPLCDETCWCRGLRQVWEAQLGTLRLQLLPWSPGGPKLPHQAE